MCDLTNPYAHAGLNRHEGTNFGGYPEWRLTASGQLVPVMLSDDLRQCTAFIYYEDAKGQRSPLGTAFILAKAIEGTRYSWYSLVTARHVIEQGRAVPGGHSLFVRVNLPDGSTGFFDVPFDNWWFHPDDSPLRGLDWLERTDQLRYDVAMAACPAPIAELSSVRTWPFDKLATPDVTSEEHVAAGDEVVVIGLYRNHVGQQRNIPIVRSGIISAMPEEPIATSLGPMQAYLAEVRSIGGLSGSPVFWGSGHYRLAAESQFDVLTTYKVRLLGLAHGHFDAQDSERVTSFAWPVPERMNEGISIVTPASHIVETYMQESLVAKRREVEQAIIKQEDAAAALDAAVPTVAGEERVSLTPLDPETALRALLDTPKPEE